MANISDELSAVRYTDESKINLITGCSLNSSNVRSVRYIAGGDAAPVQ